MSAWAIGQVAKLLGVKAHVLRYWDRSLGLLSNAKTPGGRREYSESDVQLLLRLKHFVTDRKYTLEGAVAALVEELSSRRQDEKATLAEIRSSLVSAYFACDGLKTGIGRAFESRTGPRDESENRPSGSDQDR